MRNSKIWRESASLIIAAKLNSYQPTHYNYNLLCLQRSSKSKFMANSYVFPGGNISKSDSSPQWLNIFEKFGFNFNSFEKLYPKQNIPPILKNTDDKVLPKYLSLRICAIRETFEECGILICRSAGINYHKNLPIWATYIDDHEILKWQNKVHNDPKEFLNLCSQFKIYPDIWALQNWSNWLTPPFIPIRFDTMFFFCSFHQMPDVLREEKEIQHIKWATPEKYINKHISEKIKLPNPQFYEISRLRNFADIEFLSKHAYERSYHGCETYFPYWINTDEGHYAIYPGDDLYPHYIDKDNTNVTVLHKLPHCRIQNRALMKDQYTIKLLIQNLVTKDNHVPPTTTL